MRMQARDPRPPAALVLTDAFFPPARNGRGTLESARDYAAHRLAYLRAMRSRAGAPSADVPRAGNLDALAGLVRLAVRRREFDSAGEAVGAPVLVVHARDDHHVPIDFAEAAVARHPGWRAGHPPARRPPRPRHRAGPLARCGGAVPRAAARNTLNEIPIL